MLLEPLRALRFDDMEKIHQAALTILEDVGMKMQAEEALSYLKNVGCHVDDSKYIVKFPKKVVQSYVDKMKADYDNPQRLPEKMAVRYSHIRFRRQKHRIHPDFTASAGGFCCFILRFAGKSPLRNYGRRPPLNQHGKPLGLHRLYWPAGFRPANAR